MINFIEGGDIFSSRCEALVNPVNCVGVMGKGLALSFKNKFPEIVDPYKNACANGDLCIGNLQRIKVSGANSVINFPTKKDWRLPSELQWIDLGLRELYRCLTFDWIDIHNIAIPALGCGLGGLNWNKCKRLIDRCHDNVNLIRPVKFEVYFP